MGEADSEGGWDKLNMDKGIREVEKEGKLSRNLGQDKNQGGEDKNRRQWTSEVESRPSDFVGAVWFKRAPDCHWNPFAGLRISPRMQLLATLRYNATGDMQLTIADTADMSKASVCRCVQRVTRAIARIAPRHIKCPTPTEEIAQMQAFSRIAGMPGCIGCIDGTLIPIKSPGGDAAELYRCRKDFFAFNIMAVCTSSLLFSSLVVNWPGPPELPADKEILKPFEVNGDDYTGDTITSGDNSPPDQLRVGLGGHVPTHEKPVPAKVPTHWPRLPYGVGTVFH
ncbi:putative nuclease HARBI1 [Chionoecetes opilio]|uniref:Putative nuclease HARBI1 n=1 Tax=Chionoecetes opilio TaxID=41210 RepID=A0A8J5CAE9_CHIOP|nr:putative nuclease HARBI1 [Chionoecetes opilio]